MRTSIPIAQYVSELKGKGLVPTKAIKKALLLFGRSHLQLEAASSMPFLAARGHYIENQQLIVLEYLAPGVSNLNLYYAILKELGVQKIISLGTAGSLHAENAPGDIVQVTRSHHAGGSFAAFRIPNMVELAGPAVVTSDGKEVAQVTNFSTDDPFSEANKASLFKEQGIETVDMEVSYLAGQCAKDAIDYTALFVVSDLLLNEWKPGFEKAMGAMKKAQELAISSF